MKSEDNSENNNNENQYQKLEEENNTKFIKIEEENLLDKYLDTLTFNFQAVKLIFLLIIYLTGEGFVMIGISLMVPVIAEPWNLTPLQKGLIGGSVLLGFTIGSAYAGNISDTKGRRIAFSSGNFISFIGGLGGVFFAYDFWSLFISNFLVGFGIGFSVNSIFSLTSELTNKFWRSVIIGGIWFSFVLGELAGCHIAYKYEMYDYSNSNWRLLLVLRCIGVFINVL
jgi:MFS family permease